MDRAEGTVLRVLKGIKACAHWWKVPLQGFYGETTPIIDVRSPTVNEGLLVGGGCCPALVGRAEKVLYGEKPLKRA